ncbi:MAG: CvpA family protein [Epsilonproteobacteria bacterium]|nr:CvpA family protein [Campylobacterota bacterium]
MDINYFDLVIGGIILLLGLKGVINGFFKELFGLIGIVGGVFVASRVAEDVGTYLSDLIFHFQNQSAVTFTGFLVTLAVFWAIMVAIGLIFKKLSSASGLGMVDRLFGFVLGASKFFLIIAMIAYALNNIEVIRKNLEKPMQNSILFPILVQTGSYIMHMEDAPELKELKKSHQELQEKVSKTINNQVEEHIEKKAQEITKEIKEQIDTQKHGH